MSLFHKTSLQQGQLSSNRYTFHGIDTVPLIEVCSIIVYAMRSASAYNAKFQCLLQIHASFYCLSRPLFIQQDGQLIILSQADSILRTHAFLTSGLDFVSLSSLTLVEGLCFCLCDFLQLPTIEIRLNPQEEHLPTQWIATITFVCAFWFRHSQVWWQSSVLASCHTRVSSELVIWLDTA